MGYHVLDPAAVDPTPDRPCVQRRIADELGLEHVAVNLYEADPGEELPLAYHRHDEQEELFYVLAGDLHVDTPGGTYEVPAGQVFAVEPGSPQFAYNPEDAADPLRVLALGAPRVDDAEVYEP